MESVASGRDLARARLYNHPVFERLETRTRRRMLALVYIGAVLTLPGVAALTGAYWSVIALLLVVMGCCILLHGAVRGVTELRPVVLDERQRLLRANAFRASYWVAVLVALAGGAILAAIENDLALTAGMASFIAMLVFSLPAIYLARNLSDEEARERES